VVTETPQGAKFVDEYTAARAAISGHLASHSPLPGHSALPRGLCAGCISPVVRE
jgi:hypothetical protein